MCKVIALLHRRILYSEVCTTTCLTISTDWIFVLALDRFLLQTYAHRIDVVSASQIACSVDSKF